MNWHAPSQSVSQLFTVPPRAHPTGSQSAQIKNTGGAGTRDRATATRAHEPTENQPLRTDMASWVSRQTTKTQKQNLEKPAHGGSVLREMYMKHESLRLNSQNCWNFFSQLRTSKHPARVTERTPLYGCASSFSRRSEATLRPEAEYMATLKVTKRERERS